MSTIGERLKKVRGKKSGEEFAKLLGIHAQTLYRYERNERLPDTDFIQMVAQATGASIEWLIQGNGEAFPERPAPHEPPLLPAPEERSGQGFRHDRTRSHNAVDVPVIGLAACDLSGWFNPGVLALRTPLPIHCANSSRLLAVIAIGKSMQPDGIKQGFLLFCDPDLPPDRDDVIFIEKVDGTASIKRFIKQDKEWLHIQGWLDPDPQGDQKPYIERVLLESVKRIACVVLVKRKA